MKLSMLPFTLAFALAGGASYAQDTAPTDPQIASIVVTANQVDINAGKLAESKAHSKEVKKFAKQMVTDHTAVNKAAVALVTRLKVKPEDNATSESLKKAGEENIANLKKLKGTAFDKAYIANEVTYHETVINALDKTLLPNAQNADLKALLEKSRPTFVEHLDHAKQIEATLDKSGG